MTRPRISAVVNKKNGKFTIDALRPVQIWVPDTRRPDFAEECRRQSRLAVQADLTAVQSVLADGGYVGQPFADAVEELLGEQVKIAKLSELHTVAVMHQRWGVGDLLCGSTNAAVYGRTASANSTPACSSSIWPSWTF